MMTFFFFLSSEGLFALFLLLLFPGYWKRQ